ncbi:MAG: PD40 domain-containing protein [Bacteroidetes bacterium]|nr:PD40 domain-containing protein [Bacteroidota bacterium]
MKRYFLLILLGLTISVSGQYFSTGQDPASIRWSRIKTDSFEIIFPCSFESNAQSLARILNLTTKFETKSLQAKVPRMPFIIHSHSTVSNGMTIWAPRRIELYSCPPQDIYAEPWLEQLALHEYRHAVQTSMMNRGFTKALYYLFGEQAAGAVLGLYLPQWFLEGDATVTETALSNSGRGRVASFSAPLRAQLLQKGIYTYDLATMGSYKTFTPNAYTLGYQLVAKGREKYGYELWNHTLNKVARLPFMVVPFNAGIKQKTGLWKTGFYREVMEELVIAWLQQEDSTWRSAFSRVTKPDASDYTSYSRPQFLNDSIYIASRWSNEGVRRLVLMSPEGREENLCRLGAYQLGSHSVAGNLVIWTEYRPDIRWENRSYSVIRSLEIRKKRNKGQRDRGTKGQRHIGIEAWKAGSVKELTRKSRYFAPALSFDGERILAVRITEENHSFIDILETTTGKLLQSIAAPDDGLLLEPSWSPDRKKIAYILLTSEGKSLQIEDLKNQHTTTILAPSFREIWGPPLFFQNHLLFSADYSGIENIYAIDTVSREIYQVTSARFQASDPAISPDGKRLTYSDYGADGMMVVSRDNDSSRWIRLDSIHQQPFALAEMLARQEGVNIQDSMLLNARCSMLDDSIHPVIQSSSYPVTRYQKIAHLFNIHSWAPVSIDANNLTLKPGVSVLSQNLLSTMFAGAGYEYDLSERTGKFYLDLSYEGWFPVIDMRYSYGKRAGTGKYSQTSETFRYTWNESNLKATISVPLNLSRGLWYMRIQPRIGSSWIYVIHDKTTPDKFTKGSINTLDYRLYMYNYLRSNYQDMYPKWGQNLDIQYRHTPFVGNDMGAVFGISGNLYFPGIFRHHGIRIYGGYQRRCDNLVYGYKFANLIAFPRGTEAIYTPELTSLSVNYKFPFLRLDVSLGSLLYIKRFKLNLFCDWAHGYGHNENHESLSTGFELTSEMHILRFLAPFELGVQGAFLPNEDQWVWRFLWGVTF